jgi:hypothetical protein
VSRTISLGLQAPVQRRTHALRGAVKIFYDFLGLLRKIVDQGGTTAVERMEIDGRIIRRSSLPTPKEKADPRARQRAHGGVVCCARLALRLGIDACPEGRPERCRGPLHTGVAEDGRTLEAPVDPALLATPFRDRGHACALVPCGGRRLACALFAAGDEEPGSEAGASAWESREPGEGGMALGMRRDGVVEVLESMQGGPKLADERLNEQRLGGHNARLGGQGGGRLAGVDALGNNVRRASMVLPKAGLQGRAAGQLGSLQGWPAAEKVTKNDRGFVLNPLERLRARSFQGAGEPLGEPHGVPDHAPAVCNELGQGTQGGALRRAGWQRVAVGAQPCEWQCGSGGGILRAAGGQRFAVPCEGQGVNGQEPEAVGVASGKDQGALVACKAERDRLAPEARVQGLHPRRKVCWRVVETAGFSGLGACCW